LPSRAPVPSLPGMDGPLAPLLRPLVVGTWLVGCVGALAVGVSGLLAEAVGRMVSPAFVAGDAPGVTYTTARCADYLEYVPTARSCAEAAAVHHWGEVVDSRVAVGVLGLFGLLALLAARRWSGLRVVAAAAALTIAIRAVRRARRESTITSGDTAHFRHLP
jgi:hypothetical protein